MRPTFICAIILGLALNILPASASNWLIVAVPQTSGKDGQILKISQPFHVVLSNTSLHDLKLWDEWSSKGYFNLSFEFKGKDGKVVTVAKNPDVYWFKHSPEVIIVHPGCSYSITVDFSNAKEWMGVKNLTGKMTMRVIYKNTDKALSVFNAPIQSDSIKVIIAR